MLEIKILENSVVNGKEITSLLLRVRSAELNRDLHIEEEKKIISYIEIRNNANVSQ